MDGLYTYNALASARHIRILTLAPSEDVAAALECSIDQVDINEPAKEYEALSYTWGDQGRTERLLCGKTAINITPSLAAALHCLRYQTRPRRLWADAVCINQEDLSEKGQQIPLMARIFQSALQVRVWLGEGAEGESKALADLASLDQIAGPTRSSLKHPMARDHHDKDTYEAHVNVGRYAKKILRMPWFSRRWTVQELVLNGNVVFHCGQAQISWQGLHIALHALPDSVWHEELDGPIRRKLGQLRDLWRTWCYANSSTVDCSLYSLLHSFHDLECQEPKDRIYAIAALADDVELKLETSPSPAGIAAIVPSYETSDEQVFQDLAFKMIRSGKVFATLAFAGASKVMDAERTLPSWVPHVRQPQPWQLIAFEEMDDFKLAEIWEPLNGTLKIKMTSYGWENRTETVQESGPVDRSPILSLQPNLDSSDAVGWEVLCVNRVFEAAEDGNAEDGLGLEQQITAWLGERHFGTSYEAVFAHDVYTSGNNGVLHAIDHLLWSLIRSQLLTEEGPESLDRVGSFEEWRLLYHKEQLDGLALLYGKGNEGHHQWSPQLTRALSETTIYSGDGPYFGFGPRHLHPGDAILMPSAARHATRALFLRPEGTGHRVLAGGLVLVFGDFLDDLRPHPLELRLI